MTDDIFLLDFGLFVFDVVSDVLNGVNFIKDGDIIWGKVIISTIFLPMTVFLSYGASDIVFDKRISFSKRMFFLLLIPFLLPPAVALGTPAYIIYVAYVFGRRVIQPGYVSKLWSDTGGQYGQWADYMKLLETVLEANLQAITGSQFTTLNK